MHFIENFVERKNNNNNKPNGNRKVEKKIGNFAKLKYIFYATE